MNKKQEAVLWIGGVVLAAVCAYKGSGDWIYGAAIPVVILGTLTVFALRTRPRNQADVGGTRMAGTIVGLLLAFLAFHHARRADSGVESLDWKIDTIQQAASASRVRYQRFPRP